MKLICYIILKSRMYMTNISCCWLHISLGFPPFQTNIHATKTGLKKK